MLLGLLGRKGVGKDLIADYLVKKYNYRKLAFATPLKEGCKVLFGFTHDQVYGSGRDQIDSRLGVTPRAILQMIGTDLVREKFGEEFWIDRALLGRDLSRTVISDVRFRNEVGRIQEAGGKIIKIIRPGLTQDDHSSEQGIDSLLTYDHLIVNDGDLTDLYQKIERTMREFSSKMIA